MKKINPPLILTGILVLLFSLFIVFSFRNVKSSVTVFVSGDPSDRLYYQNLNLINTQEFAEKIKEDADAPFTYGLLPEHMQRELMYTNIEARAYQQTIDVFPTQRAVIDLRENTVTLEDQVYDYTEENGRFEIIEAAGDASKYNLLQMIQLGHNQHSEKISEVLSLLLWNLWKPILLLGFGLLLLLRSRQTAHYIVKLFIKNSEPGDFFVGLIAFNGLVLLGLALFIFYQIWASLPH